MFTQANKLAYRSVALFVLRQNLG